jgi:hypothetical protein
MRMIALMLLALGISSAAPAQQQSLPGDNTEHYLITKRPESIPIQEIYPGLSDAQKTFVTAYEKVKRQKDAQTLESIIHPVSLACETKENKDFFDAMRNYYLSEELPFDYALQIVPVREEMQQALKRRISMPVPPTHVMYIEFGDTGWQRFLRLEKEPEERYYELVKCPDEKMLQEFRAALAEEEAKANGK